MKKKHILLLLLFSLVIASCSDEPGLFSTFGTGVLIGVLGGLLFLVWQGANRIKAIREKKLAIKKALGERKDFAESMVFKGEGKNSYYLATDEAKKKVFYVFGDKTLLFDYKDVEAVQIKENGSVIVSRVSTESALLGALIGDAVIGGKQGGILGAAALGKVNSQKQISSMYVHVLLNNQPLASIDIKCYDNGGEPLPQPNYRLAYELATTRAKELYHLFQGIIDQVDAERREEEKRIDALQKEELKQVQDGMQRIIAAQEMIDNAGPYLTGQLSDEKFAKIKEKHLGKE